LIVVDDADNGGGYSHNDGQHPHNATRPEQTADADPAGKTSQAPG
jgi:hypothetical protein